MRIVLIEGDHGEQELNMEDLGKAFPNTQLILCRSVCEFLLISRQLPASYILVTEHHLPLLHQGERDEAKITADFEELKRQFPWTEREWNYQEAAERLIRHIRQKDRNRQIIIYTYSEKHWIAEDVMSDPRVTYCPKERDIKNLCGILRSLAI